MKTLWILGYGRVLVDSQFLLDYSRVNMCFDAVAMPSDVREGVRLLYETMDRDYYVYTKFMNQTVGNHTYECTKSFLSCPHVVVSMPTLQINGWSRPFTVDCMFRCHGYDINLQKKNTYVVRAYVDLKNYTVTVKCRVYKANPFSCSHVQDTVQKYIPGA
jgi:hypothetical protein